MMKFIAALRESVVGPSRQAAFFGPTVANGALRTWLELQLPRPVAIDDEATSRTLVSPATMPCPRLWARQ